MAMAGSAVLEAAVRKVDPKGLKAVIQRMQREQPLRANQLGTIASAVARNRSEARKAAIVELRDGLKAAAPLKHGALWG